MDGFGFVMTFLVLWAWGWPESFGRWLGTIRAAAIRTPSTGEEQ